MKPVQRPSRDKQAVSPARQNSRRSPSRPTAQAKPTAKPVAKPAVRPASTSVAKSAAKPAGKTVAKAAARAGATEETKPVAKPAIRTAERADAKPAEKPVAKPAEKSAASASGPTAKRVHAAATEVATAAPSVATQPAVATTPSVAAVPPIAAGAEPSPSEAPAKRARRGLGSLGIQSLQRNLPTITLLVERPRLASPAVRPPAPSRDQSSGSSVAASGPVDRGSLLLLRDGLRELLDTLDQVPALAAEM